MIPNPLQFSVKLLSLSTKHVLTGCTCTCRHLRTCTVNVIAITESLHYIAARRSSNHISTAAHTFYDKSESSSATPRPYNSFREAFSRMRRFSRLSILAPLFTQNVLIFHNTEITKSIDSSLDFDQT